MITKKDGWGLRCLEMMMGSGTLIGWDVDGGPSM